MPAISVSVGMPNYNDAAFLETRIPSLLRAMPHNAELIIVDDCSTDRSVEIIKNFVQSDPRIIFHQNKRNLGPPEIANIVLGLARGEYISWHTADDWTSPLFFTKLFALRDQFPGLPIYISDYVSFRYDSDIPHQVTQCPLISGMRQGIKISVEMLPRIVFREGFWIPGSGCIIDLSRLKEVGFDKKLYHICDWFAMHVIGFQGGVGYLPEGLYAHRFRRDSYSSTMVRDPKYARAASLHFLDLLSQPHYRQIRKSFCRSGVASFLLRQCGAHILLRPVDWDFVIFCVAYYLHKLRRKLLSKWHRILEKSNLAC